MLRKTKKIALKLKTMELVQIYTFIAGTNYLVFFQFFLNFFLLDPAPQIEWGCGFRRENKCGSGTTALVRGPLSISVVEPEPDFLAGARAGEKAPAPGCCCLA